MQALKKHLKHKLQHVKHQDAKSVQHFPAEIEPLDPNCMPCHV